MLRVFHIRGRVGLQLIAAAAGLWSNHALAQSDDHADVCTAATPWLATGGTVGSVPATTLTGALEAAGDTDWFELQLRPGFLYRFNPWTLDCGICPRARALAADCTTEIARLESFEAPKVYWFLAPPDGRILIALDSPAGVIGGYSVPIDVIGGPFNDDHPSTIPAATTIAADGASIDGVLEFGQDSDIFVLTARPGAMYRLDVLAGLGGSSDLNVRFGPLTLEGELPIDPQIPGSNCQTRPEGCTAARVIAPEGEPSLLYIAIEHRFFQREDYPPLAYRLRLVDEGDFVPTRASADCGGAPDISIGEPVQVTLPMQSFAFGFWSFVPRSGHGYRIRLEATIGAGDLVFGVTDESCQDTYAFADPLTGRFNAYFRADDDDPVRLFVERTVVRLDPLNRPIPGWCVVRVEDLGRIDDNEPDDPSVAKPFAIGGRVEPGRVDYGGDADWFASSLAGGVTYRVELRVCSEDAGAAGGVAARAFAGLNATSIFASRTAGEPATWVGNSISRPETGPIVILVEPTRPAEVASPVRYELRVIRADCRGDWDGSGVRDATDLFAYLEDYFAGRGEFDDLGDTPGVGDLLGFVRAWLTACP